MSWQDDLKQLDAELSSGEISIDEHRRRRDDLLASASSTAATKQQPARPPEEQPTEQAQVVDKKPVDMKPAAAEPPPAEQQTQTTAQPPDADPSESELSDPLPPSQTQPSEERTQHVQSAAEQAEPPAEQTEHVQPQQWQQQPTPDQQFPAAQPQQWQPNAVQPGAGQPSGPPQIPPGQWPPPAQAPQRQPGPQQSPGAAWQPNWNQQWEPGPGGRPFDPFGPKPGEERDSFQARDDKFRPTDDTSSSKKTIALVLVGVLVLAVAGAALWYFVLRGNNENQAGGGAGEQQAIPTDAQGILAALPRLPGASNNEIGPTIPTDTGASQGLYSQGTADKLTAEGTRNLVYKASIDGSRQYGVLAVPSNEPGQIFSAIVGEQESNGWRQSRQPGTPNSGTGLELTKGGITYHRVLYNTGKWTIFIGTSPDKAGDDAKITQDFGTVVKSVTDALPPSK